MAEALVSIALIALEKLIDFAGQQLSLFEGFTHDLENLSHTFQSIQVVLDDAESRQVGEKRVQLWLSRLRHAAYDFEDLLEDASNHAVSRYNVPRRIKDRYNVAHRIKEIKERLDQIDAERNSLSFSSSPQGWDQREPARSQRQTTSVMDKSEMTFGRENDKEMMISRLVSESSSHEADGSQVHVVAIAGIGGLGKTTLARLVYHDRQVQGHFNEAVYWVCVSDVFDVIRLTKAILEQVKGKNNFPSELDALQKELFEALRGRRFLLVLDDVWNDDDEKWKKLRPSLTSGVNGSRILVTTRSEKIANTMKANYIHVLEGLSNDHSWSLFSSRAFDGWRKGDCSEFETTGKEILNKCKGVPLSIKVTGSAMNTKRSVEDWKNISKSKIWSLPDVNNKILPALLLTYCHLPPRLKQCFVYCSMFPKDWEFEKDMLIRLWVAQGFIRSEGNREREDIGEEYFNDLVAWSMFQEIKENYEGKIICKMHDLLHDLAEFIAMNEIYCSEGGKLEEGPASSSNVNVRHAFLSFAKSDDKPSKIPIAADRVKKLRTLWLYRSIYGGITSVIDVLFRKARFLRALYIPSSTRLPKSIGKLKHLRYLRLPKIAELSDTVGKMKQLIYLDLSDSAIVGLPESISNLHNLHTLNLGNCKKLEKLPRGIGRMVSLRYLNLCSNSNIVELPESMSDLHKLQTLNLSRCEKLKKLPTGIGRMFSLGYLDLSHNYDIVELPESVSNLCNLHTLNLNNCCDLKKLPRGIGKMISLRHLQIEHIFHLEYLPKGLGRINGLRSLNKFIVGGGVGEGCGIDELQQLNSLRGSLQIEHLERVASRDEAEKAELWKKQYLCCLELTGLCEGHDDPETGMIDSILEGLRPPENLEKLKITGLNGSKLPSWMDGMRCILELRLYSKLILDQVPHLPSLKEFEISGLINEILPGEGWEQLVALQELKIMDCDELKYLPDGLMQLPSLENLHISDCNKLESLPVGLGQLKKLESLHVRRLRVLGCLPDSVGELVSLERLEIYGCLKLESLPISLGQLKKLKTFHIIGSQVLTCLPDSVGELESLEHLEISYLKKLESIPDSLEQLKALKELWIFFCKALASLPQGLRHLSLLQRLTISNCPLLRERCKRKGGVDWPNISHIPHIYTGDYDRDYDADLDSDSDSDWEVSSLASIRERNRVQSLRMRQEIEREKALRLQSLELGGWEV